MARLEHYQRPGQPGARRVALLYTVLANPPLRPTSPTRGILEHSIFFSNSLNPLRRIRIQGAKVGTRPAIGVRHNPPDLKRLKNPTLNTLSRPNPPEPSAPEPNPLRGESYLTRTQDAELRQTSPRFSVLVFCRRIVTFPPFGNL